MLVLSLPSDPGLGRELAYLLGSSYFEVTHKVFPDGESYLRFPEVSDDEVMLVLTSYPDQNRSLLELFFSVELLSSKGINKIYAIVPYLAYGRQDKEFLSWEVVSGRVILKMMRYVGLKKLFVVDFHSEKLLEEFNDLVTNILPIKTFGQYVKNNVEEPYILIAPDIGASRRVKLVAEYLKKEYVVIKKLRDRITGEITHELPEDLDMRGVNAVIIDDIISTGGTIASIAKYLTKKGTHRIYVLASHGLFIADSPNKLRVSGVNKVAVLNTVKYRLTSDLIEYLDVTSEVVEQVRKNLIR
ncbi:MAG: ribose-phosphate diphosphokinase [Desulfurococcaceae archaeon TW002]